MVALIALIVILVGGYLYLAMSRHGQRSVSKFIAKSMENSNFGSKVKSIGKEVSNLSPSVEELKKQIIRQNDTINLLQQENERLRRKLITIEHDMVAIKDQVGSLQHEHIANSTIQPTSNADHDTPHHVPSKIYAMPPTSREPYGFSAEDCSEEDEGQIFIIEPQMKTGGTLTINPNASNLSRLISNIKYYSGVIDYVISNNDNPTKCIVKDKGCVVKKGDVWGIINKIEIDIQ